MSNKPNLRIISVEEAEVKLNEREQLIREITPNLQKEVDFQMQ